MNKCKKCGQELSQFDFKCPNCGTYVNDKYSINTTFDEYKQKLTEEYEKSLDEYENLSDKQNELEIESNTETIVQNTNIVSNQNSEVLVKDPIENKLSKVEPVLSVDLPVLKQKDNLKEKKETIKLNTTEKPFLSSSYTSADTYKKEESESKGSFKPNTTQIKIQTQAKTQIKSELKSQRKPKYILWSLFLIGFAVIWFIIFNPFIYLEKSNELLNILSPNTTNTEDLFESFETTSKNEEYFNESLNPEYLKPENLVLEEFFPSRDYTLSETDVNNPLYTDFPLTIKFKGKEINTDLKVEDLLALGFVPTKDSIDKFNSISSENYSSSRLEFEYIEEGIRISPISLYLKVKTIDDKIVSVIDINNYAIVEMRFSFYSPEDKDYSEILNLITINDIPLTEFTPKNMIQNNIYPSHFSVNEDYPNIYVFENGDKDNNKNTVQATTEKFFVPESKTVTFETVNNYVYQDLFYNNNVLKSIKIVNNWNEYWFGKENINLNLTFDNLDLSKDVTLQNFVESGFYYDKAKIEDYLEHNYLLLSRVVNDKFECVFIYKSHNAIATNETEALQAKIQYIDMFPDTEDQLSLLVNNENIKTSTKEEVVEILGMPHQIEVGTERISTTKKIEENIHLANKYFYYVNNKDKPIIFEISFDQEKNSVYYIYIKFLN